MSLTGEYVIRSLLFTYQVTFYPCDSGEHRSFGIPADKSEKGKEREKRSTSTESLDNYAREHWEASNIVEYVFFALIQSWFNIRPSFILW